jgi:cytochrome c2
MVTSARREVLLTFQARTNIRLNGFNAITKLLSWSFAVIGFCCVVVTITAYKILEQENAFCAIVEPEPVFICGTPSMLNRSDNYSREGEMLFKANCAACHKLYKDAVGPSLWGISERRDSVWLKSFIRNSQFMIQNNDSTAIALYLEWNEQAMNSFENLSDQEINHILDYLN